MAVQFKRVKVNFDATANIRQRQPGFVNFSSPVKSARSAECAINGFNIRYASGDHPLHEMEIDIDPPTVGGTQVNFNVDFVLRDSTGNYDDAYKGWVEVLVIADTQ